MDMSKSNWTKRWMHLGIVLFLLLFCSPVYAGVQENSGEYEIYPTPQEVTYGTGTTSMTHYVNVTCGSSIDEYTKTRIEDALEVQGLLQAWSPDEIKDDNTRLIVGVYGSGDAADVYGKSHGADASVFTSDTKHDAYMLWISNGEIVILGEDVDAAFYGVTTLKRILEQVEEPTLKNLTIKDYAEVEFRGFIEGYYGNPWSKEDRIDLMEFGGNIKMNQYIYAPKDDDYHSRKWRDLYTEEALKDVAELSRAGNENKCFFVYALHTFMYNAVNLSDATYESELKVVQAKFEQVIRHAGVRQIAILEDDASGAPKEQIVRYLNDMHAWLVELQKEIPDLKTDILYCPNCYSNTTNEKMTYISDRVSKEVHIVVTGGTIWGRVTEQFANDFYNGLGGDASDKARYPYMWVNWPCNDNTKNSQIMGGHNYILDKGIDGSHYEGIVLNPIQESEPSKVAIFTASDYCWNIWQTDEEGDQAWEDSFKYIDHMTAIESEESNALKETAKHQIAQAPNQPQVKFEESVDLKPMLDAFKNKLNAGSLEEGDVTALKAEFQKIHDAAVYYMESGTNRRMALQMTPFLSCLRDMTQADIDLMDVVNGMISGNSNGMWEAYADAKASFEKSKTHGFEYFNAGILYAKAGRKYIEPFTNDLLKYVADKVIDVVSPGSGTPQEAYDISEVSIKEGMQVWGSYTLDKLTDKDDSSYAWLKGTGSGGNAALGDYIQVDLGEEKQIGKVRVLVGAGTDNRDKWMRYHLAYSLDGSNWTNGDTYIGGAAGVEAYVADLDGATARYIRLVNDEARSVWAMFSEFTVYPGKSKEVKYNGTISRNSQWTVSGGSEENLTDGDDTTFVYYDTGKYVEDKPDYTFVGDYIQMDLGALKQIGRVRVLVGKPGSGDKWTKYHLSYSETGEEDSWKDLPSYEGAASGMDAYTANLKGITARYVRLVNEEEKASWLYFSEFSVYSYVEELEEKYTGTISHVAGWSDYRGDNTLLTDGNDNTYVHYNVRQQDSENPNKTLVGDWLQFDLGSIKTIGRVRVLVGNNGGDKWQEYHVEYSRDGKDWSRTEKYMGATSGMDVYSVNLKGARARYVRIVNDLELVKWVQFSEFSVYSYVPNMKEEKCPISISHMEGWGIYGGTEANLTDGDDDTFIYYSVRNDNSYGNDKNCALKGDYLQLDLGAVREVGKVRSVVGAGDADKFLKYHLAYSSDGEEWTDLATYTGVDSGKDIYEVNLEGARARYLRLINDERRNKWAKFSEFTVHTYVKKNSLYIGAADEDWEMIEEKEKDSCSILPKENAVLHPGEYIGMKLDRIHGIKEILASGAGVDQLTVEKSLNGLEWSPHTAQDTTGSANGGARYVRLINHTDADVTFSLEVFQVITEEYKPMDLLSTTIKGETNEEDARALNTTRYWMDGDLSTKAKYCSAPVEGDHVTYDMGQEIELRSVRVYVLDSAIDYPRDAELEVSADNQNWTKILTFGDGVANDGSDKSTKPVESPDGNWTHDSVDVAYAYKENTEIGGVKARYIRLRFTAPYPHRWVELNEILINGGEFIPTMNDPSFETNAKLKRNYEPYNLLDNDLTTAFSPDGTTNGYLIYNISEKTDQINGINILQSGSNISNAKVSVRTNEGWKELGMLYKSFTSFYTADIERVYAVKIEWENVIPMIYEIITFNEADYILDQNLENAQLQVNEITGQLSTATEILTQISAKTEEAKSTMEAAAEGSIEKLKAEAEYYALSVQKNTAEIEVAELEARKAILESELARAKAKKFRDQAAKTTDSSEASNLISQAEAEEAKIEGLLQTASAKQQLIEEKRQEKLQNEALAKSKKDELEEKQTVYYTVTLKSNNGSPDVTAKVKANEKFQKPENPVWDGYVFVNWCKDEKLENPYNFRTKVTDDITLHAKWSRSCTVTFNSNGGSAVASQTVAMGQTAGKPADPKKDGYRFVGWYSNESLSEESAYVFTTQVTTDITLYAKWVKVYRVTFESNGGTQMTSQLVAEGDSVVEPDQPEKEGYDFKGWYSNAELTDESKYTFSEKVNSDITLYAKWEEKSGGGEPDPVEEYTVTFNSNGGTQVPSQKVTEGESAEEPDAPTREGYEFLGWYSSEELTDESRYTFNEKVNEDITLYAKWKEISGDGEQKNQYTVVFDSQGGSQVAEQKVEEGKQASQPQNPTKEGYQFDGWYTDKAFSVKYDFSSPVGSNLTLYAKWTKIPVPVVPEQKVTDIKFNSNKYQIASGKKINLNAEITVLPSNAANKALTWNVSNPKFAKVSNGVVTVLKAGIGKKVVVTAVAADGSGKSASVQIQIMKHAVKSINLKAAKTLKAGKSMKIKSTVKTTGKKVNKKLKWTSSNEKYATVNSKGKVKALKAGKGKTVKITAYSTDGTNRKKTVKIKIK